MITSQLNEILESNEETSEKLSQLADEFRGNRDATELLELLDSDSEEFVRIGAWILSEIRAEKYDNVAFTDRLQKLTAHQVPAIRLYALSALFPFLNHESQSTARLITRLRNDENEGVRMAADAAAIRLGITN